MSDENTTPVSGNEAIARAEETAAATSGLNIPVLEGIPIAQDTANLRYGPDIHEGLLALLPLVGVWRGNGVANYPEWAGEDGAESTAPEDNLLRNEQGDFAFGQQLTISHDGENYLTWESRTWRLDKDDEPLGPDVRESGFWRINAQDEIEFVVCTSTGVTELYLGRPLNERAWELTTDVTLSSPTGQKLGRAKRLYGLVEGTDLGWVEEREVGDEFVPRMSARLSRVIG